MHSTQSRMKISHKYFGFARASTKSTTTTGPLSAVSYIYHLHPKHQKPIKYNRNNEYLLRSISVPTWTDDISLCISQWWTMLLSKLWHSLMFPTAILVEYKMTDSMGMNMATKCCMYRTVILAERKIEQNIMRKELRVKRCVCLCDV